MLHCEFRGEKWRGHIVVAVFDLEEEPGIGDHGLREIALDIGTAGKKSSRPSGLASPVPAATAAASVVIDLVLAELQFLVIVEIDERRERAADGGSFGIALRVFLQQIGRVAGEARVDTAGC